MSTSLLPMPSDSSTTAAASMWLTVRSTRLTAPAVTLKSAAAKLATPLADAVASAAEIVI